jgi:hypothetical protein
MPDPGQVSREHFRKQRLAFFQRDIFQAAIRHKASVTEHRNSLAVDEWKLGAEPPPALPSGASIVHYHYLPFV